MDLVVDANILFAAFIKNSTTRLILLSRTPSPLKLYTSPFILEEVYKYRGLLAKKTSLEKDEVMGLVLELIFASKIEIVKDEALEDFKDEAIKVSPRRDDAPYFAVALYKNCDLWSNDQPLKKQKRIIVITTNELITILNDIK